MNGLVFFLNFILLMACVLALVETIRSRDFKSKLKMVLIAMLVVSIGILLINMYFGIVRGDLLFQHALCGPRG